MKLTLFSLLFYIVLCLPLFWSGGGTSSLGICSAVEDVDQIGTMTARTSIRPEPDLKVKKLRKAKKGETGDVLERGAKGKWLKLKFDDLEGWVPARLVKLTDKPKPVVAVAPDPTPEPDPTPDPVVEVQALEQMGENKAESAVEEAPVEEDKPRVVVALDLTAEGLELDPKLLKTLSARMEGTLRKEGSITVMTQTEITKLYNFGQDSKRVDCMDNEKCIMEITKSVQNDLLLGGRIGKVGKIYTVNIYLLDTKKSRNVARSSEEAKDLDALEDAVGRATLRILDEMKGMVKPLHFNLADLGVNPRIAVMDFTSSGIEKEIAETLTDVVTVELKQFENLTIISRKEISAMLSFEGYKQQVGCEGDTCFAEIGAALGVGYLVVGHVGQVEDTYIITMKVMNIRKARIIGREQEHFVGPADGLLPAARFTMRRVFGTPYKGQGLLKLSINQDEAAVSLNGDDMGLTPKLKLPDALESGKYRVEVSKEDFFPVTRDIYVEPARQTQVQLILLEEPPEWWETWWFWTTVGVVVAGAVTTGAVLGTMEGDVPDTGSGKAYVTESDGTITSGRIK